jgi:hypothetical protein
METPTAKLDTDALIMQYVNVLNRAMGAHRTEFPFAPLLKMGDKILGDQKIGAAVYKTDPKHPHEYFTLSLEGGKFEPTHGKNAPDIELKIPQEHLENVVRNPNDFIEHPFKLDLDWLRTRVRRAQS